LPAAVISTVIDLDIRQPGGAAEAWHRLQPLLPGIDPEALPCVASGSNGESRHLYFVTDRPFYGRKLATSAGKHAGPDGKQHYDWEIELFGTGKQIAMPPSIHPATGAPYRWLRKFDFAALPIIPAATVEALQVAETADDATEPSERLALAPGELERIFADLPAERLDDYHDWVAIGQALHHQFGGSDEGFAL
jgi:hypothetical protein